MVTRLAVTATAVVISASMLVGCKREEERAKPPPKVQVPTMDIVETAVAAGDFDTLVTAIKAAELVDALKGPGPFTVFAPTDAAFAKLPPGTLEDLLKPENKVKLQDILKYHVVSGKVMASDVVELDSAETLQGQSVTIKVEDDMVHVDEAMVTETDIDCANGVIHVIDAVILPG